MFRTVHAEHCIMNEWGSKVFEVRFLRCLDQGKEVNNKLENSERDGKTRPPDLPLEKPICRSGSNS